MAMLNNQMVYLQDFARKKDKALKERQSKNEMPGL